MRIHGMMLVKDEADVILQTLAAALEWCDRIYVYDNGSEDGTWELVRELARRQPRVVPFLRDASPFHDSMRGTIFRRFRREVDDGDWWCHLDADEFYIDDPRRFLAAVPARDGEVWGSSYQYYFTDEDVRRYEEDPSRYGDAVPVQEKLRYYANNWSESRFFRHRRRLVWREDRDGNPAGNRPLGMGRVHPRRVRLRHYQYRSPRQIQRRLDSRAGIPSFVHERRERWLASLFGEAAGEETAWSPADGRAPSWRDRVVPATLLHFDAGDGRYVADESRLRPLPADPLGLRAAAHRVQAVRWRLSLAVRARA